MVTEFGRWASLLIDDFSWPLLALRMIYNVHDKQDIEFNSNKFNKKFNKIIHFLEVDLVVGESVGYLD